MRSIEDHVDYRAIALQLHASLLNTLRVLDAQDGTHFIDLDRRVCEIARQQLNRSSVKPAPLQAPTYKTPMGTNYYLHAPKCITCGHEPEEPIHLGKSSHGWTFALRIRPEEGIDNWSKLLLMIELRVAEGYRIEDEYDNPVSTRKFIDLVTVRSRERVLTNEDVQRMGYRDLESFYVSNQAERGPNNLTRSIVNHRCIGHGAGTYSYFVTDFS